MQAEFTVECGRDDAALEIPWRAEDGGSRFLDLRASPELLLEIAEAAEHPPLASFLAALNGEGSRYFSAKCDVWVGEVEPEEDFVAARKQGSYVDVLLREETSFETYEGLARKLCELLAHAPEMSAVAEVVVRRCYFHRPEHDEGFVATVYVTGYGDDEERARRNWEIGLQVVGSALSSCG